MSIETFLEAIKYIWVPLFIFAYGVYSTAQQKQDEEIKDLEEKFLQHIDLSQYKQDKKIEDLEKKVSHQMTKQDVVEVVNNAVEKLSLKMDKDLLKIDNGVHQIKNQFAGKESAMTEFSLSAVKLTEAIDILAKKIK